MLFPTLDRTDFKDAVLCPGDDGIDLRFGMEIDFFTVQPIKAGGEGSIWPVTIEPGVKEPVFLFTKAVISFSLSTTMRVATD